MKNIGIIIVLLFLALFSNAQNYQDVVYLKSGSVIRGTIIEQVPGVSIKIETADKNVFVFKIEEVDKMTREVSQNSGSPSGSLKNSGYLGMINFGYGMGTGDADKVNIIKFDNINGYQFNQYFSLGFGYGIKYWWVEDFSAVLVPLYADARGYFLPGKVSPFLSFQAGYSIELTPAFQGLGMLLDPSLGVRIRTTDKNGINIGLGLYFQKYRNYNYTDKFVHFDVGFFF